MPTSNIESVVLILSTTALILLLAGFIISMLYMYQKKQFVVQKNIEEIKLTHEKNILQTQLEIHEQTCMDISRDIHDNISLGLTLSKLYLNTLNYADPEETQSKISLSVECIGEAIRNLNDISKSLNSDMIRDNGLLKAIENEISNLHKTGLYSIVYEVTGSPEFLDSDKELVVFRIIQETLNNIIKHAAARNIRLLVNYSASSLEVTITDDGRGFPETDSTRLPLQTGAGLNNIRKRTTTLNGTCEITAHEGKGACIKVAVPLKNNH